MTWRRISGNYGMSLIWILRSTQPIEMLFGCTDAQISTYLGKVWRYWQKIVYKLLSTKDSALLWSSMTGCGVAHAEIGDEVFRFIPKIYQIFGSDQFSCGQEQQDRLAVSGPVHCGDAYGPPKTKKYGWPPLLWNTGDLGWWIRRERDCGTTNDYRPTAYHVRPSQRLIQGPPRIDVAGGKWDRPTPR